MALTEEEKQRIAEEEAYRAKIQDENKKSGCLVAVCDGGWVGILPLYNLRRMD